VRSDTPRTRELTAAATSDVQPAAPVFTDLSGRRRRVMRLAGLGLGAVMLAFLAAAAAGLLGGPRASFLPWGLLGHPRGHGAGAPGHAAATSPAGVPVRVPAPAPFPAADMSPSVRPAPAASATPALSNRAGKTPPGRNRTPGTTRHTSAP
jgi:hypothetical protein